MTFATLFSGLDICGIGMEAAGLTPLWGVEKDPRIAAVARANGMPVRCGDVAETRGLPSPDVLHASPPCPNFSQAKTGATEQREDLRLARAVVAHIQCHRPRVFTLENVYGYRRSLSCLTIWMALRDLGYGVDAWRLCAADYGVPQTRWRLILVARRNGRKPTPPPKTHTKAGGLFADRWRGWYGAIEDLIPGLPDDRFAQWQLDRLPESLRTLMIMTGNTSAAKGGTGVGVVYPDAPARTVLAGAVGGQVRALLLNKHGQDGGAPGRRAGSEPTFTVDGGSSRLRAFCMGAGTRSPVRHAEEPHGTVTADSNQGNSLKAFVASGGASDSFAAGGTPDDNGRTVATRTGERPYLTVTATHRQARRAFAGARVVRLTPRCLARFQTIPDWYDLPEGKTLACRGIGNAWPALAQQRIYEHLLS